MINRNYPNQKHKEKKNGKKMPQNRTEHPRAQWQYQMVWHSNVCVIGIPEETDRKNEQKRSQKTYDWKFSKNNEMKDLKPQIQKTQRIPSRISDTHSTHILPGHIMFSSFKTKNKVKILKAVGAKRHITYRITKILSIANFLSETGQARRQWVTSVKCWKKIKKLSVGIDFKWKTVTKNKKGYYIMIKGQFTRKIEQLFMPLTSEHLNT